jgi:MoaA/NifB/PqqE/SkfB family radical SAM enzyme
MRYAAAKRANLRLNNEEARLGLTRLRSRPLYFWFDIYGPCNLKCAHCTFQKTGRTSDEEVSEGVYQEVLRELMPTALVCNLGGTNYGEMTISRNFQRFLQDCRTFGVRVNLTTNGTRMNDAWLPDLLEVADVVGFSMEGLESQFEAMRGFPWRRFRDNIEKLVQGRRERAKTFRIEWRYCAHADSIHQLPDMIRLARHIGIDRIQVMPLVPFVAGQKFKSLGYHRSLANQYFRQARDVARELAFDIDIPADYDTGTFENQAILRLQKKSEFAASRPEPPATRLVSCYRPWQACSINELGVVTPCGIYWRPMGRLSEQSFERVWNGRRYRAMRRSVNGRPHRICYDCRMPKFETESGLVASEMKPSLREAIVQSAQSLLRPSAVRFEGVLDHELDPSEAARTPA